MQPPLFFTSGPASSVQLDGANETAVITCSGVVTPLGPQTVQLFGAVFLTTGADTTAITLAVRRLSLTGTLVGDAGPQQITAAVGTNNWYSINVADTPGDVTGYSYVLTVEAAGASANGETITGYLNAFVS